jgi:hypothetical protein
MQVAAAVTHLCRCGRRSYLVYVIACCEVELLVLSRELCVQLSESQGRSRELDVAIKRSGC